MKNHTLTLVLALVILGFSACQNDTNSTPASSTNANTEVASPPSPPAETKAKGLAPAKFRGLEVQPFNYSGHIYMGIRQRVDFSQIQPTYATNMNVVFNVCYANNLEMDPSPSALFYEYDEAAQKVDMASVIGVKSGKEVGQGVKIITIPAGLKALKVDYYGNYRGIAEAHYAITDYLQANQLVQNRDYPAIEDYVTSPKQEPDPNKRLTRLIYFYL